MISFKHAFLILVIGFGSIPTVALARNCTSDEKAEANQRLDTIQNSPEIRKAIINKHLPFNLHRSSIDDDNSQVLFQGGYVMSHDPDLRTTIWVSYRLTGGDIKGAKGQKRVNCFRRDPRLDRDIAANPADYKEPIYDQGHMANDADMKDDLIEQANTYLMSNMSPQHCRFNRGIWLSLEHLTRIWAADDAYGDILVTSGAIFDRDHDGERDADQEALLMKSSSNKERVGVPSSYFKVILRQDESGWKAISFLLNHTNVDHGTSWGDVKQDVIESISTISEIEKLSGLTLHPALNRSELSEGMGDGLWDFATGRANFNSGIKDTNNCVVNAVN